MPLKVQFPSRIDPPTVSDDDDDDDDPPLDSDVEPPLPEEELDQPTVSCDDDDDPPPPESKVEPLPEEVDALDDGLSRFPNLHP